MDAAIQVVRDLNKSMPSSYVAQVRHALYYLELAERANNMYKRGGEELRLGLEIFDQEWTNIRSAQTWAEKNAATGSSGDFRFWICDFSWRVKHQEEEQKRWDQKALG